MGIVLDALPKKLDPNGGDESYSSKSSKGAKNAKLAAMAQAPMPNLFDRPYLLIILPSLINPPEVTDVNPMP